MINNPLFSVACPYIKESARNFLLVFEKSSPSIIQPDGLYPLVPNASCKASSTSRVIVVEVIDFMFTTY